MISLIRPVRDVSGKMRIMGFGPCKSLLRGSILKDGSAIPVNATQRLCFLTLV